MDLKQNPRVILTYLLNALRTKFFGIQLPPPRRLLKKGDWVRDEHAQAISLVSQLRLLHCSGVDGAFCMTFVSPTAPTNDNPRLDLDMNSYSLVKTLPNGRGVTYPDMTWEPKEAFNAVADFYGHEAASASR